MRDADTLKCAPIDGPIAPSDANRLADLHIQSLPSRLLPLLGRSYLQAFYRFIAQSDHEQLYVSRSNDGIAACCIVTSDETSVLSRAVRATLVQFIWATLRRFFVSAHFRQACFSVLKSGRRSSLAPQILVLFTDPTQAGHGIGRLLVDYVCNTLDSDALYTKTEDGEDKATINFYQKNGFAVAERSTYADQSYVYLRRDLTQRDSVPG